MLELHYPTVTKTILERQYPGKPTLKVAFGNDNGAIFENSSLLSSWRHDGHDRQDKQTTKFTTPPDPEFWKNPEFIRKPEFKKEPEFWKKCVFFFKKTWVLKKKSEYNKDMSFEKRNPEFLKKNKKRRVLKKTLSFEKNLFFFFKKKTCVLKTKL